MHAFIMRVSSFRGCNAASFVQAEADDKASKAIDRYMYRAFREDDADSNPLTRRNNLSISNPLL